MKKIILSVVFAAVIATFVCVLSIVSAENLAFIVNDSPVECDAAPFVKKVEPYKSRTITVSAQSSVAVPAVKDEYLMLPFRAFW
jgi:hypothetical protein